MKYYSDQGKSSVCCRRTDPSRMDMEEGEEKKVRSWLIHQRQSLEHSPKPQDN